MKPLVILPIILATVALAYAELPSESSSMLEKLKEWELDRQVALQQEIRTKREEVVDVLKDQLSEKTKAGKLQEALAIEDEIKRLLPGTALEPETMLGFEEDKKIRIPREAFRGTVSHYLWIDKQVSWIEAKTVCEKLGGNLVCIEGEEEWNEILNYRDESGHRGKRFWIGLTAPPGATDYQWVDGSPGGFENWAARPTSNPETTGVVAGMNGSWIGFPSEENPGNQSILCEWPKK